MQYLFDLPNKEFAFECLNILIESNKLKDQHLETLLDKDKISRTMHCNYTFPILREVSKDTYVSDEYRYENGYARYYPDVIFINNRAFIVSNDWYCKGKSNKRDNRTPFVRWIDYIVTR
jgi:hypothetical protein